LIKEYHVLTFYLWWLSPGFRLLDKVLDHLFWQCHCISSHQFWFPFGGPGYPNWPPIGSLN